MLDGIKLGLFGAKEFAVKNAPAILTFIAVGGVVATAVTSHNAGIKAIRLLDEEEEYRRRNWVEATNEDESSYPIEILTPKEKVLYTWKCYLPAVAVGVVTITAIIGSNRISTRRYAALAGLYTIAERAARNYQKKVLEKMGEKQHEQVKEELAQQKIDQHPMEEKKVTLTGRGESLCFDSMTGRYFRSNQEYIRKVVNDFNRDIVNDGMKTLNEFYITLGLEPVQMGDYIGWGTDYGFLEIDYRSKIAQGEPCLILSYDVEPRKYY